MCVTATHFHALRVSRPLRKWSLYTLINIYFDQFRVLIRMTKLLIYIKLFILFLLDFYNYIFHVGVGSSV
jgi:hypothetical protein